MRRLAFAALLSSVIAGSAAAADCNVTVEQPWAAAPAGFKIQAMTIGPSCGRAIVVLVLRDEQDVPLWIETLTTMQLELLGVAETPDDMRSALSSWIQTDDSEPQTGRALPEWPEDADPPTAIAGLTFELDADIDNLDWQAIRNADAPVYCYSLEMSRRTCVALDRITNAVERIGRLIYPDQE